MEQVKEYLTERMKQINDAIKVYEKAGNFAVEEQKREQFYELARLWDFIEQIEMTEKETL